MPGCRPETAPFCPAWNGTRSTVARALKLIDGGALEHGSVDALAEKLGITSRHLARLFERHVGASPQQVATTRRVQRAKRLLDTTDDTMTEIAFRAGFGSVRRFNAAFSDLYGRSPSSLRATSRGRRGERDGRAKPDRRGKAIRSPILPLFWHCGRPQNSSRTGPERASRQRTVNGFG